MTGWLFILEDLQMSTKLILVMVGELGHSFAKSSGQGKWLAILGHLLLVALSVFKPQTPLRDKLRKVTCTSCRLIELKLQVD